MEIAMNKNQKAFISASERKHGRGATLTRDQINDIVEETGLSFPFWLTTKSEYRAGRGQYEVPTFSNTPVEVESPDGNYNIKLVNITKLFQPPSS